MSWFFYALAAPFLWSISNHLDKILIEKYFKGRGTGALIIFSSIIGFFALPIIFLYRPTVLAISPLNALLLIAGSIAGLIAILIYLYSLKRGDTSVVVALWQTIPIFGFVLGYLGLGETLTRPQLFGSALIMGAAIAITINGGGWRLKLDSRIFFPMLAASFLVATGLFIFKFVALQDAFWTAAFWGYVGDSIAGFFFLFFVPPFRREFFSVVSRHRAPLLTLNGINEVVSLIASLLFRFATLLAPLALVLTVNGLQPLFVFLIGTVLTVLFPTLHIEDLSRRRVIQKIIAIAVMFVGTYILNQ